MSEERRRNRGSEEGLEKWETGSEKQPGANSGSYRLQQGLMAYFSKMKALGNYEQDVT